MACRCRNSSAGCVCVVDVADTPTVDMTATGTGDAGTPRVISSVVKVSGAAGNTVVIRPDGLFVGPTPLLPPGCGLSLAPDGSLVLDLGAFSDFVRRNAGLQLDDGTTSPLQCADTTGAPVYCASDGILRTRPVKSGETAARSSVFTFSPAATIPQNGVVETDIIPMTIVNPSTCDYLCGYLQLAAAFTLDSGPNANPRMDYVFDLDGDGVLTSVTSVWSVDTRGQTVPTNRFSERIPEILNLCLEPGETRVVNFRTRFSYSTAHAGGTAAVSAVAHDFRFYGHNL